ncbi:hypothetical protein [Pseudoalteromonas luteoviolacea]|uniref:Uncharacterized protein n=2 Tax=Pseudoalteromonas TaxID=53246 RepID=V4H1C3_PSEL2|nr:hypothetical protein [Pseudoalteromonas luteoviolacea]ESP91246.1 hypothetical protein PL2TA16_00931 [Pseudoalteromonas luteoviolacea 2ta16]KZN34820.1 hypothetical protein N483_24680 [Pseudoalteromonas luteoviolacea NCIMB 1944]
MKLDALYSQDDLFTHQPRGLDKSVSRSAGVIEVTCVCAIKNMAELHSVLRVLEMQSLKPVELVICHSPELCIEAYQKTTFDVRLLPTRLTLSLAERTSERLALAVNCDYVVIWPVLNTWVSKAWIRSQITYLREKLLDAAVLSLDTAEDDYCPLGKGLCCTKEFFLAKHQASSKKLGFQVSTRKSE